MSTAAPVPPTVDLEGDDAFETAGALGARRLIADSVVRFRYADGFSHSRALAFQLLLTAVPGLIALVGFAELLGQGEFRDVVTQTLEDIAPGPASDVVLDAFRQGSSATDSGAVPLVLGGLAALVAGAGTMGQIERGSNRIYGVERDRPAIRKYALAVALACTAGLASVVAFVLLVPGSALGEALKDVTGWGEGLDVAWSIGRWILGAVLAGAAVGLLFKVSPRRPQPAFSWLAVGSGLSVVLWFAFTGFLALYVEVSRSFGDTYGPLAGMVGFLFWSFLTALALFLGLAVAAQLEAVRANAPDPRVELAPPPGSNLDSCRGSTAWP
jgi:YihY family inner membrane protein